VPAHKTRLIRNSNARPPPLSPDGSQTWAVRWRCRRCVLDLRAYETSLHTRLFAAERPLGRAGILHKLWDERLCRTPALVRGLCAYPLQALRVLMQTDPS
jgi:hypothetical protein